MCSLFMTNSVFLLNLTWPEMTWRWPSVLFLVHKIMCKQSLHLNFLLTWGAFSSSFSFAYIAYLLPPALQSEEEKEEIKLPTMITSYQAGSRRFAGLPTPLVRLLPRSAPRTVLCLLLRQCHPSSPHRDGNQSHPRAPRRRRDAVNVPTTRSSNLSDDTTSAASSMPSRTPPQYTASGLSLNPSTLRFSRTSSSNRSRKRTASAMGPIASRASP